jgi:hypothetical protein
LERREGELKSSISPLNKGIQQPVSPHGRIFTRPIAPRNELGDQASFNGPRSGLGNQASTSTLATAQHGMEHYSHASATTCIECNVACHKNLAASAQEGCYTPPTAAQAEKTSITGTCCSLHLWLTQPGNYPWTTLYKRWIQKSAKPSRPQRVLPYLILRLQNVQEASTASITSPHGQRLSPHQKYTWAASTTRLLSSDGTIPIEVAIEQSIMD